MLRFSNSTIFVKVYTAKNNQNALIAKVSSWENTPLTIAKSLNVALHWLATLMYNFTLKNITE